MVKSPEDIHRLQTPTINELSKRFSGEEAAAVIVSEVSSLVIFLNVGKTMNSDQVVEVSRFMFEEYSHYSVAHFKLFFSKFKKGHFGKQYDRIDGQVIIQSFDQFISDCTEEIGRINANEHYRREREFKENPSYHPDVIAAIKSAVGEKKIDKPKPINKPTDIGQKWFKQFNNLHKTYGIGTGIRMIKIGNTIMDIDQFFERKLKNNVDKQRKELYKDSRGDYGSEGDSGKVREKLPVGEADVQQVGGKEAEKIKG